MLTVDYNLFLKLLVIYYGILGVCNIIVGASGMEKPKNTKYGATEVLWGLGILGILLLVVIF